MPDGLVLVDPPEKSGSESGTVTLINRSEGSLSAFMI